MPGIACRRRSGNALAGLAPAGSGSWCASMDQPSAVECACERIPLARLQAMLGTVAEGAAGELALRIELTQSFGEAAGSFAGTMRQGELDESLVRISVIPLE